MALRNLNATELAVICSNIVANRAMATNAGNAVAQLSTTVQQGFNELTAAINDFPVPTNIVIPNTVEQWHYDENETSSYKYHYDIVDETVTAYDMVAITIARQYYQTASDCGLCPENETYNGYIRIRAISIPTSNITAEYYIHPGKEPASSNTEETNS